MKVKLFFQTLIEHSRSTNGQICFVKKNYLSPNFLFYAFIACSVLFSNQSSYADYLQTDPLTSTPAYSAFLTDSLEEKKAKKEFNCMNRIYLYFSWRNITGTHEITAFWINPKGRQQNQINLKFIADKPKVENWVALEFNNLFNEKYPLVPDISATKFVGKWQVKILLDGNLLETKNFLVNCG